MRQVGSTALHFVAAPNSDAGEPRVGEQQNKVESCNALLAVRCLDVNARRADGQSAFALAIEHGSVPMVTALAEAGADILSPETAGEGLTPLMRAARANRPVMVAFMLERCEARDVNRRVQREHLSEAHAHLAGATAFSIVTERGLAMIRSMILNSGKSDALPKLSCWASLQQG